MGKPGHGRALPIWFLFIVRFENGGFSENCIIGGEEKQIDDGDDGDDNNEYYSQKIFMAVKLGNPVMTHIYQEKLKRREFFCEKR